MSGNQRAVTVTTTATRLDTAEKSGGVKPGSSIAIYNASASTVYIGMTSGVTTANGVPVAAASWGPSFDLDDEAVYGIVASGTADVRVIETGV